MSSKILTTLIFFVLALIAAAIVVGFARDKLDAGGVITSLSAILGGLVLGALKQESDKKRGDDT